MLEELETFEAPTGLSEIRFTTAVDVSYTSRDGRDDYIRASVWPESGFDDTFKGS